MTENANWLTRNFNEDETLLTDDAHQRLLVDDFPVVSETDTYRSSPLVAERGRFVSGRYQAPSVPRKSYIESVQHYALQTDYESYGSLTQENLMFLDRIHTMNLFHPDFVRAFNGFLSKYGDSALYVVRGLTPPLLGQHSAHTIGMAIDLLAPTKEEAHRIMNAAWLVGFQNIVQAGSGSHAHIHLDITPNEPFLYDGKLYEGPWSI